MGFCITLLVLSNYNKISALKKNNSILTTQATLMVLLIFIWTKHSKLYFTDIKSNLAVGQFDKPVR